MTMSNVHDVNVDMNKSCPFLIYFDRSQYCAIAHLCVCKFTSSPSYCLPRQLQLLFPKRTQYISAC